MELETTYQLRTNPNLLFYVLSIKEDDGFLRISGQWSFESSKKLIGMDELQVTQKKFERAFKEYA